jgi:hypothetical protein
MTICPIPRQGSFVVVDAEGLASKKPSGRDKGAITYSSVEHVALLSIMSQVPDSFSCSESSPQWEEVYKRLLSSTSLVQLGFPVLCMGILWTYMEYSKLGSGTCPY